MNWVVNWVIKGREFHRRGRKREKMGTMATFFVNIRKDPQTSYPMNCRKRDHKGIMTGMVAKRGHQMQRAHNQLKRLELFLNRT